jgi:hypothetical protein
MQGQHRDADNRQDETQTVNVLEQFVGERLVLSVVGEW